MRKKDLDIETALEQEVGLRKVSRITASFIQAIRRAIDEDGWVYIEGLGQFNLVEYTAVGNDNLTGGTFKRGERRGKTKVSNPLRLRIHFKKATSFGRFLHQRRKPWTKR